MVDNKEEQLKVTSVDKIQEKTKGIVVKMPGWDEEAINVRLRRPSILGLVKQGVVPNELMSIAEQAINGKAQQAIKQSKDGFKKMTDLLYIVAEEAIVEPEYEHFEGKLTDEQLFFIYSYVMQGVRDMKSFRKQLLANVQARNGQQEMEQETE